MDFSDSYGSTYRAFIIGVLKQARKATRADEAIVFLHNPKRDELYLHMRFGKHVSKDVPYRVRLNESKILRQLFEGIASVRTTAEVFNFLKTNHIGSLCCSALKNGDKPFGALFMVNKKRAFTADEELALNEVTSRVSAELNHVILTEKASLQGEVISRFHNVSQELLTEQSKDLRQVVVREAKEMLGADFAILYQYDRRTRGVETPPAIDGKILVPGKLNVMSKRRDSIVVKLVQNASSFFAPIAGTDWVDDLGYEPESIDHNFFIREKVVSSAGIPLIAKDEVVGVLFINYRSFCPFTPEQRERIGLFAHITAMALRRDRVMQEQSRSVVQLKVLNELGEKLNRPLESDKEIFQIVHQQTGKLMNVDNFYIALPNTETGLISFPFAIKKGQCVDKDNPAYQDRAFSGGLTEYVLEHGHPVLLERDVDVQTRRLNISRTGDPSKSWLGVPIIFEGKMMGMIGVQDFETEGAYDEAHRDVLHTIATQLAPVLEQRRLLQETQAKKNELELLREAEFAIRSKESLQERLQTIVGNAAELLGAQGGKLYKLNSVKKTLELVALEGEIKGLKTGEELAFGEGLSGQVFLKNEPDFTNDYASYKYRMSEHGQSFKSLLGVPLTLADGSVVGVLTVFDIDDQHEFTARDIPVLQRFGRYVAQAMRDADQLDLVEKQVSRLNITNQITRSISAKLELDDYLNEIASTIKQELDCDQCAVLMRENLLDGVYLVQRAVDRGKGRHVKPIRFSINNKSLACRVYHTGESEIFSNAPEHPDFDARPERGYQYTSMMLVPMRLGTKCMGVICVDDSRPDWFKLQDREWVETLALNIAIALQSSLAAEGQQVLSKQLLNVLGISQSGKAEGIRRVMRHIARQAMQLTHGSSCVMYLLSEDKKLIVESYHPTGNEKEHPIPRTKNDGKFSGLTGWIIEKGESVHIPDVASDKRVNPILKAKIKSLTGIPLKDDNDVIGVLYVNHAERHESIAIESRFLFMLADQAALAIKKHALLQRIVRTRNAARAVGNLSLVEDWSTTLKSLVKGALYALQCDAAVVIPYSQERHEFEFPVFDGVWYKHQVFSHDKEGLISSHDRILAHEHDLHVALDVKNDKLMSGAFVIREKIKSSVGVRLEVSEKGKKRVVGVMFFNYRTEKREIGEQEQEDIRLFASLAANTIRSAQVYRKLDTIRKTARTFAYKNLGIKKDLAGTLKSIAAGIKETLECDLVVLHEYALEEKQFKMPFYFSGNEYPIPPKKRSIDKRDTEPDVLHYVLGHEDMLTTNGGANAGFLKGSFPEREQIKSTAAIALGVGEEKVGVLFVSYRQQHRFTETEKEDIKLFADQAAIAIRNAQLYQEKQMETRKYETLLHNSPGGVLAVNRQGRVIFANEKLQTMLNYSEVEIKGKHVNELYGGGRRESRRIFRDLTQAGRLNQQDASAITRDGHRIPTLLTAALMDEKPSGPEEVYGIGIVEDQRVVGIGGRTGKVLELTRQMARYERMHEVVNLILLAGIEIFNADDIGCLFIKEDGKFVLVEESNCSHVFGNKKTYSIDHSIITQKAEEGKPFVVANFPPEGDRILPCSRKSRSGVLIPFMGDKDCLGVLYLEKDIPDFFNEEDDMLRVFAAQGALALMRAQLIDKQKSWESTKDEWFDVSKAVVAGQIASTFLHEVKNSLNIIVVNARQLKQKIEKESGIQKKGDYLSLIKAIHDGVAGAAELAKESQRFKGKLTANKKNVYLNDILDRTIKLVEPALHKKRLKYSISLDTTLSRPARGKGHLIYVDPGLVELVLINLVMNAVDASAERGKILITSSRNETDVQFEVIDYGHGIEPGNLGNIFRPFYTLKKQTGVGLGLYICKLIVEDQHEGTVEVNSVPGKTTFTVHLPISSQR